MPRSCLLLTPLALLLLAACNADVEEGCLSSPCEPPGVLSEGAGGAGGGPSCTDSTDVGDFPCDVFTALQAKCLICHSNPPVMLAPFPLATFEDTQAPYGMRQRWERMAEVIASDFMPLTGSLNSDEKKLLLDWLHGCAQPAPAGMGCE